MSCNFLWDLQFGQPIQYKIMYRFYLIVFIIFVTKINEYIMVIMDNLQFYLLERLKQI